MHCRRLPLATSWTLQRAAVAILLIASTTAAHVARAGEPSPSSARPILSSPVTHSDWMGKEETPDWGPKGVHQILDRAKQCGWRKVYWRCLDGGRALYPSKVLQPLAGVDEDNYHRGKPTEIYVQRLSRFDWASFDAFREAVDYGHSIGLEVHAWLSINEDDHGWGWTSRYTREHPESRWVCRDGRVLRSQQSFAFPEVRAYKLAVVKEVLDYRPDGIFFDWIRTGDVRDNPHTDADGVAIHGYERPNIDRFRELYGVDPHQVPNGDPRWVAVRAEPQTCFMRDARRLIREKIPACEVTALVQHRFSYRGMPTDTPYDGSLRGLLVDVKAWADEGLIDAVVAAGYYRPGGDPTTAYREMQSLTSGKVKVLLFGWLTPNGFAESVPLAEKLGAPEILLWESDYVGLPPQNGPFVEAMQKFTAAH